MWPGRPATHTRASWSAWTACRPAGHAPAGMCSRHCGRFGSAVGSDSRRAAGWSLSPLPGTKPSPLAAVAWSASANGWRTGSPRRSSPSGWFPTGSCCWRYGWTAKRSAATSATRPTASARTTTPCPTPLGIEHAAAFAAACGHPEAAEDLAELLAEELDPESVIESERLVGVLRLLGLPRWLVAASSLPRDVPTGLRAPDVTRLGAGVPGFLGRVCGRAADLVRRRRPPPPAVTEAPRGGADVDPWGL